MSLIKKLKEYSDNVTVDQLEDDLQNEVLEWVDNFAQESFVSGDEREQVKTETLRISVSDILEVMENE